VQYLVLLTFSEISREMSSSVHECHRWWCRQIIVVEQGVCFTLRVYELQHEGLHGSLSTKGECSSMVEDTPTTAEHGRQDVSLELFEEQF
jgi:hypothetical protein